MNLNEQNIPGLTYDESINHIHSSLEHNNKEEYKGLSQILKEELASREPTVNHGCSKCKHKAHDETQIRAAGGVFGAIFDVQSEKYRVITCKRCNHSELYKSTVGIGQ